MAFAMDIDDTKLLERYTRDKLKAESKQKLSEVAQFCNCIGEIYSKYGCYEEAIEQHTQERGLSEALGDKIGEAVASRKIGECYCALGRYSEALELQKRHLTLARECKNDLEEQRAWATIGRTYLCQSETRSVKESEEASKRAEKAFFRALEACEKLKQSLKPAEYMAMKGRLYLNLGLVYDIRGDIKQSSDAMKRAVLIAEKYKLDDELYMCHVSLANLYQKGNNHSQALRCIQVALKLAQKLRNKIGERELLVQKAMVLINIEDFLGAKHCLKSSHKLKVTSDISTEKLKKMFATVNRIQESYQDLSTEMDENRKSKLYETVADCCAELGNYAQAIQNYLKILETSEYLTKDRRAAIYVSLAQTYADVKQFDNAIFYYNRELEERTENPEQTCRTLLNIAELEELKGSKYATICKIYVAAFEAAGKAKHRKLQVQALKSLILLQTLCKQMSHLKDTEKKLAYIKQKYNLEDNESQEEDDEDKSDGEHVDQNEDGALSLSDLTVSDDSNEEDSNNIPLAKKSKFQRRNEKGETPLHRACIDGNLKKVKTLISEGHPVNPRDYCGWLPIHEASNHGHTEIVAHLLDCGAWINDRGGDRCGGVTPLIDAANCGSLSVVNVLVDRGANLLAKDDDGNSALDCLQAWFERTSNMLCPSDVMEYKATEKLLKSKKAFTKSTVQQTQSTISSKTMTKFKDLHLPDLDESEEEEEKSLMNRSNKFREKLTKLREKREIKQSMRPKAKRSREENPEPKFISDDSDSDGEIVFSNAQVSDVQVVDDNATTAYRSAIESIGSSAQRCLNEGTGDKNRKARVRNMDKRALIYEEEDIGDDWLINDVSAPKMKKKSAEVNNLLTTSSFKNRTTKKPRHMEPKKKHLHHVRFFNSSSDEDICGSNTSKIVHPAPTSTLTIEEDNNFVSCSSERHHSEQVGEQWDSDDELLGQIDTIYDSFEVMDSANNCQVTSTQNNVPSLEDSVHPQQTASYSSSVVRLGSVTYSSALKQTENLYQDAKDLSPSSSINRENISKASMNKPFVLPTQGSNGGNERVQVRLKLKVKIEERTLLIPILSHEENNTVKWLMDRVSERYFNIFLKWPHLSLTTSDGVTLCLEDSIAFVLSDGDVLQADVQSWDSRSVGERYNQACKIHSVETDPQHRSLLENCWRTGQLKFGDLGIGISQLLPVFQALEGEIALRDLDLSGNRLDDTSVKVLVKFLTTVPKLRSLNLDSSRITAQGVDMLATALKENLSLDFLESLSLSHNLLADMAHTSLTQILRHLPNLISLNVTACNFSPELFTVSFQDALRGCKLKHCNVAENKFNVSGVQSLLNSLCPDTLLTLDLSHCLSQPSVGLSSALEKFLTLDNCCLQTLSLSGCHLNDEDVLYVNRLPTSTKTLKALNISMNQCVTTRSLQKLLCLSCGPDSCLQELTARGCAITSPLDTEFIEALKCKINTQVSLKKLVFSCRGLNQGDIDSLRQVWSEKWGRIGHVKVTGVSVVMSVLAVDEDL